MNINVLSLKNPFSFFCVTAENTDEKSHFIIDERKLGAPITKATHGQYVAVFWHNKWSRGIVNVEANVMIWLVDYGIHIRPNEDTVYVDLPGEYRKLPSKVFEASIHGVVPLEKVINEECQIENKISKIWNKGATEKAQELIKNALDIYFEPIAILTTKYNDVVLGDLYIKLLQGYVNIIDELQNWPVFIKRDPESYIKYLTTYYPNRKLHRACLEKPKVGLPPSDLPTIVIDQDTLENYQSIINNKEKTEFKNEDIDLMAEIGSTVVGAKEKVKPFRLSPSEVVHYSDMYVNICGTQYNALQLLLNKIRDLEICETYQDAESVGRGLTNRYLYKNNL